MFRNFCAAIVLICLVTVPASYCAADDAREVKALVEKAARSFSEKGRDYTLKLINARGPFAQGQLYVYAVGFDNKVLAHPYNKDFVGRDVTNLKDTKGKFFAREMTAIGQDPGHGWVDYYWVRHGEQKATLKRVYVLGVPSENLYVAGGYYVK